MLRPIKLYTSSFSIILLSGSFQGFTVPMNGNVPSTGGSFPSVPGRMLKKEGFAPLCRFPNTDPFISRTRSREPASRSGKSGVLEEPALRASICRRRSPGLPGRGRRSPIGGSRCSSSRPDGTAAGGMVTVSSRVKEGDHLAGPVLCLLLCGAASTR